MNESTDDLPILEPSDTPPGGRAPIARPRFVAPGYCRKCQEELPFVGSVCCRCHEPFSSNEPATFRKHPHFFALRFWFPGFCLAVASGVISYAIIMQTGQMGWALFVSVPVSIGAILGYSTRAGGLFTGCLAFVAIAGVIVALISFTLAGFFCGATLAMLFVAPTLIGLAFGMILRGTLKFTTWDQRNFLPIVFFLLLPYACELIENTMPRKAEMVTVRTGLTIDATPEEAWQALMFYEDVHHAPPWLLHLALPKPIRSEGRKSEVGDRVRCVYDSGELNKQITAVDAPRKLAFDVTLQRVGAERYVALEGGSFEFIPVGKRQTRIVLQTRYRRWLRPDFFWQPIESEVVHTLHEHVIEGVRREVQRTRGITPPESKQPKGEPGPMAMREGLPGLTTEARRGEEVAR